MIITTITELISFAEAEMRRRDEYNKLTTLQKEMTPFEKKEPEIVWQTTITDITRGAIHSDEKHSWNKERADYRYKFTLTISYNPSFESQMLMLNKGDKLRFKGLITYMQIRHNTSEYFAQPISSMKVELMEILPLSQKEQNKNWSLWNAIFGR